MIIPYMKTHPDAIEPKRATPLSSGFDLHALDVLEPKYYTEPIDDKFISYKVLPGERVFIRTGIAVNMRVTLKDIEAQVRPRSGLALKQGIHVHLGTIDQDYMTEIGVVLFNLGEEPFEIKKGDRIAQLVFVPVLKDVGLIEVERFVRKTGRGGFGSTGV